MNTPTLTGYTVRTGGGYRAAVKCIDPSAIPFIGRPFIQRRILPTVWVHKSDALEIAELEARRAAESGVMP